MLIFRAPLQLPQPMHREISRFRFRKEVKITITSIGYAPASIQINKESAVTVLLEETSKSLDEVVVVGYGTQKVTKFPAPYLVLKQQLLRS